MRHLLFLAGIVLVLGACEKNPYEAYEGPWSGTYSGDDDNGKWDINIDEDGQMEGAARSDSFPDYPLGITGTVSESGVFDAEASLFGNEIQFNGQISGDKASGTWKNDDQGIEGSWEGEKE